MAQQRACSQQPGVDWHPATRWPRGLDGPVCAPSHSCRRTQPGPQSSSLEGEALRNQTCSIRRSEGEARDSLQLSLHFSGRKMAHMLMNSQGHDADKTVYLTQCRFY